MMRIAKHLAHAGVASRRACERLIAEGRVTLAGEVVLDPATDVGEDAEISLDGHPVGGAESRVVYALNKPVGVLSTAIDPLGRPTVVELVKVDRRLYPVGRLDMDSHGLIVLTNDGQLAHTLTHPSFEVEKTYLVTVSGSVTDDAIARLCLGVVLDDGPAAASTVRRAGRARPDRAKLEITIREGRNRQVRRMCAAVGHPVEDLVRIRFGPLRLGSLPIGGCRLLDDAEVDALRAAGGGSGAAGDGSGAAGDGSGAAGGGSGAAGGGSGAAGGGSGAPGGGSGGPGGEAGASSLKQSLLR